LHSHGLDSSLSLRVLTTRYRQFVPKRGDGEEAKQIEWAHLDIAGTAWGAASNKTVEHGASGVMVRALHRLITENE